MAKYSFYLCSLQKDFDVVAAQLNAGFEAVGSPLVLQNAVVYELVDREVAGITSAAKIDISQVDSYVAKGYVVQVVAPDGLTATVVKKNAVVASL